MQNVVVDQKVNLSITTNKLFIKLLKFREVIFSLGKLNALIQFLEIQYN